MTVPNRYEEVRPLGALTYGDLLVLCQAVRAHRKRVEREVASSTFIPEEGKRHAGHAKLDHCRKLEQLVKEAIKAPSDENSCLQPLGLVVEGFSLDELSEKD